jgi:hypothetical protein
MSHHGAIMFKGFDIMSAEEWISIMHKSGLKEMPYEGGGSAVRKIIVGKSDKTMVNI